jgi:hypothetical protein
MEELIRGILVVLFGLALIVPYALTVNALFPRRLRRTRFVADSMPGRSFLAGLVNGGFFGVVILGLAVLGSSVLSPLGGAAQLPALTVLTALLGVSGLGLAAVAQLIGERLRPQDSSLRQNVWGVVALSLGSTLPLVGWFVLLPYAGLLGLGAFILSFFVREQQPTADR